MQAIQFIKDHGVEKAREVVIGAMELVNSPMEGHNKFDIDQNKTVEVYKTKANIVDLRHLKRIVESVGIINKFDSVQEAKDAISNSPDGATDYRKLSCSTRYIKQSERFFEYWDGSIWCRPTVPFTDETHILRFTRLCRLQQAIADYEAIHSNDCEILDHPEDYTSHNCKKIDLEQVK